MRGYGTCSIQILHVKLTKLILQIGDWMSLKTSNLMEEISPNKEALSENIKSLSSAW